jgi:membrane-associated protease RseP (regulator of RpoE activity)
MNSLIAILAIGLLIALHEAGHLVAARAAKMRVMRYSIGFFHPLFSWVSVRSGTLYQLGILPLGGFVQIKGMNPYEKDAFEDPESYQNRSVWRRLSVALAGPFTNLLVAWIVLTVLYSASVDPLTALIGAGQRCFEITAGTFVALAGTVTGTAENVQALGPVGIIKMAATTLETGPRPFFALFAYLSLMLAIFNMLPIPALDGGRALFLLVEAVTGRRVNAKVDLVVSTIGFVLLLGVLISMTVKELFWG